ncbi:hypothetical protein AC1031_003749 [Aphanomyces cochlioides]|nr:hypothetical protein AC1031_003749 [Aphanomyces cochlioides]
MLLVDSSPAHLTPVHGTAMMETSDVKSVVDCQICFDSIDQQSIATKLCGPSCRAAVCHGCLHDYIRVQTESLPTGVLAKLNCPICIRPANLMRWKARCPSLSVEVDAFAERVRASCNILCPSCHYPCNVLPHATPETKKIKMKTHFIDKIPLLRQRCHEFCRHETTLDDLCQFVRRTFPAYYDGLMKRVVPLIHDTERRAALFLRLTREQPFIRSSCCKAQICFTCKASGHHEGVPCQDRLADVEDIAACPQCSLTLVKGDGCSWVTCFCGYGFSWPNEVERYRFVLRWNHIPPRFVDALAAVFRPFLYFRRLRKQVAPAVRCHVLTLQFKPQFLAVCNFLRGMAQRRRFHLWVFPQLKRHVIMLDIAKQKKHMLVVLEYLKKRVWQRRFLNKVLQSDAFRDEIVRRRSKHCVEMVQTHPWIRPVLVPVVKYLYLLMIKARKERVLVALTSKLAWQRYNSSLTEEEREEVEMEKLSFMTMFLDDDEEVGDY